MKPPIIQPSPVPPPVLAPRKTRSVVIVLALVLAVTSLAFVVIGAATVPRAASQRQAIQRVFLAESNASVASWQNWINGAQPIYNHHAYAREIKKISVSKCPAKFREAWAEYVATWERYCAYNLLDFGGELVRLKYGSVALFKNAEKRDTHEAWRQVEKSARAFGVDVPPQK